MLCVVVAMLIFDTDVLIFAQRGNEKAIAVIDSTEDRALSVQTYMELLQRAQNKEQNRKTLRFIQGMRFAILPLSENIGHRASVYVEEYSLSHSMAAGDAIIASTAVENGWPLLSGNAKHFRAVKELQFMVFKP